MSYRIQISEKDLAGFTLNTVSEIGAMVINSSQGPSTPVKCQSENDVLTWFGKPSATYPEVFEAIAYCRKAPAYICSAYTSSGSLYGGVDIHSGTITAFGTGRDYSTYVFTDNTVSHAFFTTGPQTDNLAINVIYTSGSIYSYFTATLYKVASTGNTTITSYNYSLTQTKDGFGRSLYYVDVFKDNPYVNVKINSSYVGTAHSLTNSVTQTSFTGGVRITPATGDYVTAWAQFQNQVSYKADIFMDVSGKAPSTILSLVTNYQPWAFGITMIPMGYSASAAITYRNSLGISSDQMALYTNWMEIQDDYNNSRAWISQIGSVGGKYAMMYDIYNGLAPAGLDENNHGGQLSDWRVLDWEYDYTDFDYGLSSDLQNLDFAQINPIIFSEVDGIVVMGDRTLLSYNTDTSFIGTRRLYNLIEDTIKKQILKKQIFKLNDKNHRLICKTMTTTYLEPILNAGLIRDMAVVCDESNNTSNVLNNRQFILDVYIKVTPTSEWVNLHLIRVGQNLSISSLVQGVAPTS